MEMLESKVLFVDISKRRPNFGGFSSLDSWVHATMRLIKWPVNGEKYTDCEVGTKML